MGDGRGPGSWQLTYFVECYISWVVASFVINCTDMSVSAAILSVNSCVFVVLCARFLN